MVINIIPTYQTVNIVFPIFPILVKYDNFGGDKLSIFYDNYLLLCNSLGKSPTKVALEIGLNRSAPTSWKSGIIPRDATLQKIAKYFGTTTEYLLTGKTLEYPQKETATQAGSGLIEEFGRIFDSLTPENQTAIIAEMLKRQREQ